MQEYTWTVDLDIFTRNLQFRTHLLEADAGAVLATPSPDQVVVTKVCILPTLHVNNFVTSTASRKLIHFVRHGYASTQHKHTRTRLITVWGEIVACS